MTQKTSFKSRLKQMLSFFLSDLKSCNTFLIVFGIISAVAITVCFTICVVLGNDSSFSMMLSALSITGIANSGIGEIELFQYSSASLVYLISIVFTIIYTVRIYSYLHNKRKADLYGSLPIGRATLFIAKSVSAYLMSIIPAIFFLSLISIISVCSGHSVVSEVTKLFPEICMGTLASISFFGLIAICCGTMLNSVLMFIAVCVAYPLSAIFIKGTVVGCFDGFYVGIFKDSIIMNALNPLAAYDGINVIYWLIFSVVCIVLGAFLAKKRKAERAQSAFAFHLPCYIIKVLVSFLAGMFLGVLFGSMNVFGGYAGFVFGFILASVPVYIIVHLILYRGFSKLIKTSIPLGALIIVSCVGVALCCFDAFGYNSYVPKTQDIKSAGFYDANSNYQSKGSAVGKNLKDMADDITDKDTIANILEAHYQLVDNRNYSVKNKFKNTWVSMFKDNVPVFSEISKNPDYAFAYTLNNGNIVTRTYSSASAFEETESYLTSSYNELDTSDIIYSKGYIKAYSPLVKADYKDINTFIVAGFDGKATDDKHPDFVSSKIIYTDDDGTVSYSKNYKNTAEKIKEAFLKDLDNCSDEDFAKIDQMTDYADHALDVAYVNYGEYESFIKSEPDAVCVIAIATGDVNSYYDGIRNMDSYNGNTAARAQVVYTVPKSFKNTIKALQELGILNSKLYMDKDYLPGDSTSYKEYTGEYYYDDYTSSSDLYDYTDDSYIDDSEY
ncbi:ABC transporter permease [Ruminococcus bromii]|uniref:ABC transporter permease n=1 Tax=Ruminococcus bromii TaxID=40518 RepID=UPI00266EF6EB|nr:ABC transporter permease [Ruminococcus bromii]